MSWFSSSQAPADGASNAPNFFPVTALTTGFGELSETDTAWAADTSKGFRSETQVWYSVLSDGTFLLTQVIWSYTGIFLVPAAAQLTFKLYSPHTRTQTWRSLNSTNFTPSSSGDRRGCKANEFEIVHSGGPTTDEKYVITASFDKSVQISVTYERKAGMKGFKFGEGPEGGYSIFGKDKAEKEKGKLVIHRFLPYLESSGSLIVDGKLIDAKGDAMFVHAIQGMRPDTVASRWNFAFFTSGGGKEVGKLGSVRAVQMEFETPDEYGAQGPKSGRVKCNIGAIYLSTLPTNPVLVVGQTHPGGYPALSTDVSKATHTGSEKCSLTGYDAPTGLRFEWAGKERGGGGGDVKAEVEVKVGVEEGVEGLIQKIDVLAEFPAILRRALSAVAGIKPYIFQYMKEATLNITIGGETVPVEGWLFSEASFVSP